MFGKVKNAVVILAGLLTLAGCSDSCCDGCKRHEEKVADKPVKVLLIGNSFSVCAMPHLPKVAADLGVKLDIASLYIGGCSLERHWNNVLRDSDKNFKPYAYKRNNCGIETNLAANVCDALRSDKWDIVTIQQVSHLSWQKESYHPYGDKLVAKIRELAPTAKIVVQETWSYTPWDRRLGKWKIDQNEMYERLHDAYADFASMYSFDVIPMGSAIQQWRRQLPVKYTENSYGGDVVGGGSKPEDKHFKLQDGKWVPNSDMFHLGRKGDYFQAIVWAKKLFNVDLSKLNYCPEFVTADQKRLMCKIADEVCAETFCKNAVRTLPLADSAWAASEWISVKNAPTEHTKARAASGTSCFVRKVKNAKAVKSAKWMTAGLGVYEIKINGRKVGDEILKPGFTHVKKTRRSFTYDVTALMDCKAGAENIFSADVSAGWWRDKIVNFHGKKSAFRAVLELTYADGTKELVGTKAGEWCGFVGGPVVHAAIFDGEIYDARIPAVKCNGTGKAEGCEVNKEFAGVIIPSEGAEVYLRKDRMLKPVEAYVWQGVTGEAKLSSGDRTAFGKVNIKRTCKRGAPITLKDGETLVVDFGQNSSAVPHFRFNAAKGTVLKCLFGEMLNDANGELSRGNDGPAGSLYRQNLRVPKEGMEVVYTFADSDVSVEYMPTFTFFGYRYVSVTVTGKTIIESISSIPVTSIRKDMETASIVTGDESLNQFISNVYWGQLSNYLSVPTDCPQRNERLGWTADTQVFAAAALYNACVGDFLRKWMRDMDDSRCKNNGYPGVAPFAQYGNNTFQVGWADAGVVVPYEVWTMTGDKRIIDDNFDSMMKYIDRLTETEAAEPGYYNYADWLSFDKFETHGNKHGNWNKWAKHPDAMNFRRFLHMCYWLSDARMLSEMAAATGRTEAKVKLDKIADQALATIRKRFLETDGLLLKPMRDMQTACVFALSRGILQGENIERTKQLLQKAIDDNDGRIMTGFLGTAIILDTLSAAGMTETAYSLMLSHKCPGWLYSVDQGATTVWERWDSYTKDRGFGPVWMNSFNHYAYGCVLAWMYRTMAGIAVDPTAPGFKRIIMNPVPNKRVGYVKASYNSAAGIIKSEWRYADDGTWAWTFTIPEGAEAIVSLPWATNANIVNHKYGPGSHRIVVKSDAK